MEQAFIIAITMNEAEIQERRNDTFCVGRKTFTRSAQQWYRAKHNSACRSQSHKKLETKGTL